MIRILAGAVMAVVTVLWLSAPPDRSSEFKRLADYAEALSRFNDAPSAEELASGVCSMRGAGSEQDCRAFVKERLGKLSANTENCDNIR